MRLAWVEILNMRLKLSYEEFEGRVGLTKVSSHSTRGRDIVSVGS